MNMAYHLKKYQQQEAESRHLYLEEHKESEYLKQFHEEAAAHFEEYIRLCSGYRNGRKNIERRYEQMLDGKKQIHEKEEMKRSICMKI